MNFHQISDAERELIDVMRALSPERRAAAKRAVTREYWRNLDQIRRKATCSVDPRNARATATRRSLSHSERYPG